MRKVFSFFKPKRATLIKYPNAMDGEEIGKVFQAQGEDAKIWQALDAVIDNHLLDAVNDVSDPKNDTHSLSHASGRVDAISTFKSKLEEFRTWKSGKTNYN